MQRGRHFGLVIFFAVHITVSPVIAAGVVCGQPDVIPAFTATLDPGSAPQPPAEPYSLGRLDLYRAKLEIFRKNTVESYNRKVIAYSETLSRLDKNFRKALTTGACTAAEYETVRQPLEQELAKAGSDYLEPYWQALDAYSAYWEWCKRQIAIIRFSGLAPHGLLMPVMAVLSSRQ